MSNNDSAQKIFPSGYSHTFDVGIACHLGVHAAVIYNHITYWLRINKSKNHNQHENRTWMYETIRQISEFFGYLSEKQVRDSIDLLLKHNLLIKGNFNKSKFDRTAWYALANETIVDIKKENTTCPKGQMKDTPRANQKDAEDTCIYNNKNTHKEQQKEERPSCSAIAERLFSLLLEYIKKTKPDLKEPNKEAWTKELDRMLRIDKRDPDRIIKVIEWLPTDEFWSKNILSAEKLRKQFDALELAMRPKTSNYGNSKANVKLSEYDNL